MDQDGSEHNICSNREGLCPGKKQHGASGWKKIFQHGKEPLRNKDSISQYCNKKAAVSLILNENVSETLCIFSIDKTNCSVVRKHSTEMRQINKILK